MIGEGYCASGKGMMMDTEDDAVAWVREWFNDPTYYLDVRVLDHIARDPGFADVIKEMITRPPSGLRFRVDISGSDDPDLISVHALERLNARLRLIDAQAVPCVEEQRVRRGCLWTVRVPQSHEEYVRFLVSGRYGTSSGPDGEALVAEVEEFSLSELTTLRQCFTETRAHLHAGLARLQGEKLPQSSGSPSDMLHYLVQQEAQGLEYHLAHLEHMYGIVAREQLRRSTRPNQ